MMEHIVPEGIQPLALERYLRRAWPMLPGHVWRDALKKRDVRVNGVKCPADARVTGGDVLNIYLPDRYFDFEPDILFEDDRLIIAIKPQGLPVDVDQDGVGVDTLLNRLKRRWPGARLCHRLDAATGGLVMAANDESVYQQALEAFENHAGIRKYYRALALGGFEKPEGVLKAWLKKDARQSRVQVIHRSVPGAKPIETAYRVEKALGQGVYSLWLEPVTGRTHQLRAHMADFGHPLLGDDKYGDHAANRRYPGVRLCLWHERMVIAKDSPLLDYRGRSFEKSAPDWLDKK